MGDDGGEVLDCMSEGTCGDEDMGGGAGDIAPGVKLSNLTLWQETTLAIQQFSIVAGVCLMVGSLFFMMIVVDKIMEWMGEQWNRLFDKGPMTGLDGVDEEDPRGAAALVGSFKRYKN